MLLAAAAHCAFHTHHDAAGALAAEREWVRAIEHRDTAALGCLLAPDFTDSDWRGRVVTRAQMLDGFAAKPRITLALDQLTVDVAGDMAVVRGRNRQAGLERKTSGAVRFTDVFVYRDGAWRALRAQETVIAP